MFVVPSGAAVSGLYAAWLHGVDVVRPHDPLQVTACPGSGLTRAGRSSRESRLHEGDLVEINGVLVTAAMRTAFDVGRQRDLAECVVGLDAMAHAGLVSLPDLATYAEEHRGWQGLPNLRRAVRLAEPKAESPMESRMRMVVVLLGGMPAPEPQVEIRNADGYVVARVDLGDRKRRAGMEYDGRAWHGGQAQVKDDRRDNGLVVEDWVVLRYGGYDVYRRPQLIVRQWHDLLVARDGR